MDNHQHSLPALAAAPLARTDRMFSNYIRPGVRMAGGRPVALVEDWTNLKGLGKATGLSPRTLSRFVRLCPSFPSIVVGTADRRFVVSTVKQWLLDNPDEVRRASEAHAAELREARQRKAKVEARAPEPAPAAPPTPKAPTRRKGKQ